MTQMFLWPLLLLLLSVNAVPVAPITAQISYLEETARAMYLVAGASYCDDASLEAWTCAPCKASGFDISSGKVFENSKTDSRGFVYATTTGEILVSFRGTETLTNWIENLKVFNRPDRSINGTSCGDCRIHDGFDDTWRAIRQSVLDEVKALRSAQPSAPVYVVGHSLGGAVAVLAATDLLLSGVPLSGIFTYGTPRVGNKAFAKYFDSITPTNKWRVTHHRDIVPHLPLEDMGYYHTATEVFYTEDSSSYRVCDGSGEDTDGADSLTGLSIHDHLHYFNIETGAGGCSSVSDVAFSNPGTIPSS